MPWTSIKALLLLCLVLVVYLWFRRVWNTMKARKDAVDVANRQRQALENSSECSAEAFSAVLARSENIYHQAVVLYNAALKEPLNRLPAAVMGFRPLTEEEIRK